MKFTPYFSATAIGSMPHRETAEAVGEVLLHFKQIPFWPQLTQRSFLESMYVQFSEKFPGILINEEKRAIYVDTKQAERQLEECYQHYLSDDTSYFAISPEYAQGLYVFLEALKENEKQRRQGALSLAGSGEEFIKGQITGPISFGLTVTDENKRSIIYNPLLRDALIKVLAMKAKWQVRKIKMTYPPQADEYSKSKIKIIIFIDEPYLAVIGSAYINLRKEDIIKYINEIVEAIHAENALAGIHCCGNTDWPTILNTKTDIISFDAYNFIDNFFLFSDKLRGFLEEERVLAWGIVPASLAIDKESAGTLAQRLERGIDTLCKKGLKKAKIENLSLITPSCGTGTLPIKSAESILKLTVQVSEMMRRRLR